MSNGHTKFCAEHRGDGNCTCGWSGVPARERETRLLAEVDALTKRVKELEGVLKLAQRWLGDAEDYNANFEDIAEWFRKDTGHLRPGKDSPFRDDGSRAAWEHWSKTMAVKIREAIRAALLTPDAGTKP